MDCRNTTEWRVGGLALFLALSIGLVASPCVLASSTPVEVENALRDSRLRQARLREETASNGLLHSALHLRANGDLRGAVRALIDARSLHEGEPQEASILLELGRTWAMQNERTLALQALDELLIQYPGGELADDALLERALLFEGDLPGPERFVQALDELAVRNPLFLEPGSVHHLIGLHGGYRLQETGPFLRGLERVWKECPAGDRAPEALLRQAYVLGLGLGDEKGALALLEENLLVRYPRSGWVDSARLLAAFLRMSRGDLRESLDHLSEIPPEAASRDRGAWMRGVLMASFLGRQDEARHSFLALSRSRDPTWRDVAELHLTLDSLERGDSLSVVRKHLEGVRESGAPREVQAVRKVLVGQISSLEQADNEEERAYLMGVLWRVLGDGRRALRSFESFLGRYPGSSRRGRVELSIAALRQESGAGRTSLIRAPLAGAGGELDAGTSSEARWRRGRREDLERLMRDEGPWKKRAIAVLARRFSSRPEALTRLRRETAKQGDSLLPSPSSLRDLGQLQLRQGRDRAALEAYKRLVPYDPSIRTEMARIVAEREARSQEESLPTSASAWDYLSLAASWDEADRPDERRRALQRASRRAPLEAAAEAKWLLLEESREGQRIDILKRLSVVDEILQDESLLPSVRLVFLERKARLLIEKEETRGRGLDLVRYLANKGHKVAKMRGLLARAALEAGDPRRALAELALLSKEGPRSDSLLVLKAEALAASGEDTEARHGLRGLLQRGLPPPLERRAARLLGEMCGSALVDLLSRSEESGRLDREALSALTTGLPPAVWSTLAPALERSLSPLLEHLLRPGTSSREEQASRLLARWLGEAGETLSGPARLRLARGVISLGFEGLGGDDVSRLALCLAEGGHALEAARALRDVDGEAALTLAKILEGPLGDPEGARARRIRLARASDEDPEIRARAALELGWLEEAIRFAPRSEAGRKAARLVVSQREEARDYEGAAEVLLAQAAHLGDTEDGARATLEAARLLIREAGKMGTEEGGAARSSAPTTPTTSVLPEESPDRGRLRRASELALEIASSDSLPTSIRQVARDVFRDASGRLQLDVLEASLNWDDPEAPANREALLRMSALLVSPVRDYDRAATRLLELTEVFPETAEDPRVLGLRQRLPSYRLVDRLEEGGPQDRLLAGLVSELSLEEPRRAAELYESVWRDPDAGALCVEGGLYLLRAKAVWLGEEAGAGELLQEMTDDPRAKGRPWPGETAAAYVEAAPLLADLVRLAPPESPRAALVLARNEEAASVSPTLVPADRERLAEMGRVAAVELHDAPLLLRIVTRLKRDGPEGRRLGFELLLEALEGIPEGTLDPARSLIPWGPWPEDLARAGLEQASSDKERGRAWLALAAVQEMEGDIKGALRSTARALGRVPAKGELHTRVLAKRAKLLESLPGREGEAAEAYRRLATCGDRVLEGEAQTRLPLVLAQKEARETEDEVRTGRVTRPGALLGAARRQARELGRLEEAVTNYRAYLRVAGPGDVTRRVRRELAEVLLSDERYEEALGELARLLTETNQPAERARVVLRMAEIEEGRRGDFEAARSLYETVLQVAPEDGQIRKQAEEGLARIEDLEAARGRASKAGEAESTGPGGLGTIRETYVERGDFRGAVEALREEITRTTRKDQLAKLYQEMARILEDDLQDYEEAADAWRGYLANAGNSHKRAEKLTHLATLLSEKLDEPREAMKLYDEFLQKYYGHPLKVSVLLEKARLLETYLDDVQGAVDIYRHIANAFPRSGHDEKALLRLAVLSRTYFTDFRGAVEAYERIASTFPFSENAPGALYRAAAILELELADLDGARQRYQRLIQTYPGSPLANDARNALARIEVRRR